MQWGERLFFAIAFGSPPTFGFTIGSVAGALGPIPGRPGRRSEPGDFDHDGHSDILWQNASGQAAVWDMNRNSVIGGGAVTPNPGPGWKLIGSGDSYGAGDSDLLWQNSNGQLAIWEMNGTTIVGDGAVSANPGPAWKAVGLT